MGTFISRIKRDNVEVPQEKRKELGEKLYRLMTMGGMMVLDYFSLFDKKYITLKPIQFNDNGFYFTYNYFEDDIWESAGYNEKKGYFWSNKIGNRQFGLAVVAGYTLEREYLSGIPIIDLNGSVRTCWGSLMWINTALGESYKFKHDDPWEQYLILKQLGKENNYSADNFSCFWDMLNGFRGMMDIIAVTQGIPALIEELDKPQRSDESDSNYKFRLERKEDIEFLLLKINQFKDSSTVPVQEQYEYLISLVRNAFILSYDKDILEQYEANNLDVLYYRIVIYGYTGVIGRIIADVYSKDFWEVWERIKDVAKREPNDHASYAFETDEMFFVSKDDLVYYWSREKPIDFSDEMQEWLHSLKNRFYEIMTKGVSMHSPLKRIQSIMDFAEEHYFQAYFFNDFLNETMENIVDSKYMALWQLFDEVLHVPENLKTASVLFEVDHSQFSRSRRCDHWFWLDEEYKFNKGRQAMRRFIALMANHELRNEIFGF